MIVIPQALFFLSIVRATSFLSSLSKQIDNVNYLKTKQGFDTYKISLGSQALESNSMEGPIS